MSNPSNAAGQGGHLTRRHFLDAVRHRPRIYICGAVMVAVYLLIPHDIRVATRALLAWNIGALLFIVLVGWMMARCRTKLAIRERAALEDEQQWILLVVGTVAACASLAAIVSELGAVKEMVGLNKAAHVILVGVTIVSAWTFIHLLFTMHYAHEYYADRDTDPATPPAAQAGLIFPGEVDPTYSDFLYYSFVIGCASQTADVATVSKVMRRTTLAHGIVSFFFNTVILALTINIGAGLIAP
jgi:uncharacterized membrane protein